MTRGKALFKYYWYTSINCMKNGWYYLSRIYYDKAASIYEGWVITITGEVL